MAKEPCWRQVLRPLRQPGQIEIYYDVCVVRRRRSRFAERGSVSRQSSEGIFLRIDTSTKSEWWP